MKAGLDSVGEVVKSFEGGSLLLDQMIGSVGKPGNHFK